MLVFKYHNDHKDKWQSHAVYTSTLYDYGRGYCIDIDAGYGSNYNEALLEHRSKIENLITDLMCHLNEIDAGKLPLVVDCLGNAIE